jgi:hypothetical protein
MNIVDGSQATSGSLHLGFDMLTVDCWPRYEQMWMAHVEGCPAGMELFCLNG